MRAAAGRGAAGELAPLPSVSEGPVVEDCMWQGRGRCSLCVWPGAFAGRIIVALIHAIRNRNTLHRRREPAGSMREKGERKEIVSGW